MYNEPSLVHNGLLVHNIKPDGTFILAHRIMISEILPRDRKSYPTHVVLPRLSHEGYVHW